MTNEMWAALIGGALGGLVGYLVTWRLTIYGTAHMIQKMIAKRRFDFQGKSYDVTPKAPVVARVGPAPKYPVATPMKMTQQGYEMGPDGLSRCKTCHGDCGQCGEDRGGLTLADYAEKYL